MATNSQATFDIGPLSWVKAEIEHSLGEARKHLDKLAALPLDAKELKYILTHLHQVSGALSMVGLGAATRFNEEAEKLAASFEASPPVPGEDANRVLTLDVAMTQLSAYLDALLAGQPDQPMVLAKSYLALNQARGAHDASETDLFSPDLSLMMPDSDATVMLPRADMMGDTIKQWRSAYQAGLLKLLRDKDIEGGLRAMRSATVAIEALQVTSPSRAFWYAAVSFFDTLTASPADTGALAVQVLGKIDQQIKLLIEGVQRVPEKLFRELLLVVGRSTISTHRVKTTCEMYRLKELLALPAVGNAAAESEKTALALRGLRDQIAVQKDDWLKFTSGTRPAIEAFVTNSEASAAAAVLLGNKEISQLLHVVCAVGVHLKQSAQAASESLGLEVATALLYAETATENFAALGSDESAEQSAGLIARVKSAMSGAPLA